MLDSETIGIRIKKTEADRLRELAREIAFKEHRTLTVSGLIKEAINKAYPYKGAKKCQK